MKRAFTFILCGLAAVSMAQLGGKGGKGAGKLKVELSDGKFFVIELDKGSPQTISHIAGLLGKKFYDGIRFHRVEDWVVQWGDPVSRTSLAPGQVGGGGSGKNMPFEASKTSFKRGVVGIASTGSKVGGDSQIFVVKRDSAFLDGNYAVLGKVTEGMAVIDKLQIGAKIKKMYLLKGGPVAIGK